MRYLRRDDGVFLNILKTPVQYTPYSPEWLNSLGDEEKQAVAGGLFGKMMHESGGAHVSWLYWRGQRHILGAPPIEHNGSAFVLDCGRGPFVVTAAHVYSQFLSDKKAAKRIASQIGNLSFDLEARLIDSGHGRGVDIATFRIETTEVSELKKAVVKGVDGTWPPPPNPGESAYFGGFLGSQRVTIGPNKISFGLHGAMTPVTDFTDHQIRCRLDRRYWVDVRGIGLPLPGYDVGGMSGGPLLVPHYVNKQWSWRLAGVISEAKMLPEYEVVTAARAHFILPDGRIT